jgi:hypothetical protein
MAMKAGRILIPLALLLASIYLFWILPIQRGPQALRVEFSR